MTCRAAVIILRGYKDTGLGLVHGTLMSRQGRLSVLLGHFGAGPGLFARGLIKVYRHSVSALTVFDCRHLPAGSTYADEAVGGFGLWAGGRMTLARLSHCHAYVHSALEFDAA